VSEKPKVDKEEPPLLYALSRKVGLDVLEKLITPASLKDVNKSNQGVLWYAVFIHKDSEIITYIIDQLNTYNISLSEISQVISSNANTALNNMLEAYLIRMADVFSMDKSDCQDLRNPSEWQVQITHKKKKGPTCPEKKKVENYFKSNKNRLHITWHLLERQKERGIGDDILYKLLSENLSKYSPKGKKNIYKGGKNYYLRGKRSQSPFSCHHK